MLNDFTRRFRFTSSSPGRVLVVFLEANTWLVRVPSKTSASCCQLPARLIQSKTPTLRHGPELPPKTRTAVTNFASIVSMPSRPRLSKVAKPNGNTRNRKPLPDAGLQELEHQYVVANANVNGHASIGTSVSLDHGQLTLAAARGSAAPKIDSADGCANFPFASQSTPYPMLGAQPSLSALELAFNKYGDAVKIDSALCKKVAGETAKRMPTQRRPDQKLNIDRRSNMEAFLAHVTGQVASKPCKNCHKGHGPWSQCVVYDGQMCGSCTNCWYNASGSRCTYHGM